MKNNYKGFRGWINYIRDYKDNIDNDLVSEQKLIDANKQIRRLEERLKKTIDLSHEKDTLIQLREQRIEQLTTKISELKVDNNTKQNIIAILNEQLDELSTKYQEKEHQRRVNAVEIGHRQRKINKLEKEIEDLKYEIEKKDHKINFLKASKHAPTKEEVEAYEMQMKEVEKRIKNK